MVTAYIARSAMRDLLLASEVPNAESCAAALVTPGDDLLVTTQHANNLARTLDVKYRRARELGHIVDGLEEVTESLKNVGAGHVRGVLVKQDEEEWLVALNQNLTSVLGVLRIVPRT